MTCQQSERYLPDLFHGRLNPEAAAEVRRHLAGCGECRELSEMWTGLGDTAVTQEAPPTPAMRQRLDLMIAAFREGQKVSASEARVAANRAELARPPRGWLAAMFGRPAFQAAFALSCLVLGLLSGVVISGSRGDSGQIAAMREELHGMRQLVTLSLLQQQSASDRLRGVSFATSMQRTDPDVTSALFQVLQQDQSVDVRLAAIDALRRVSGSAAVRQRLMAAFQRQESPLVQISLIDALAETHDRDALGFLQREQGNAALQPVVRKHVEEMLQPLL